MSTYAVCAVYLRVDACEMFDRQMDNAPESGNPGDVVLRGADQRSDRLSNLAQARAEFYAENDRKRLEADRVARAYLAGWKGTKVLAPDAPEAYRDAFLKGQRDAERGETITDILNQQGAA